MSLIFAPFGADPFITGRLSRSSVCIFYPNRRGKDRCVRFFALLGDMPFLLRRALLPSFDAAAQSSGKSLSHLQQCRGSIFRGVQQRYCPCKGAFQDLDRVRAQKPEWGPIDSNVLYRRKVLSSFYYAS